MTTTYTATTKTCPFCAEDAPAMRYLFSTPDHSGSIPGVFAVYRCSSCGTGMTDISVNNAMLHQMYDDYYDIQNIKHLEAHPLHRWYRKTHLQRITNLSRGRRLLDIGCGSGLFVKAASEMGFIASGIDISQISVESGRSLWNLDLQCTTIDEFAPRKENRGKFDIITMYSVLEHVTDPRETLLGLQGMLADGGLLVAEVPNFSSIQARVFRSRWFNLDVPRHLFHYSVRGLKRLVHSAGYDVIAVRPGPAAIDFGIPASLMPMPASNETLSHKVIRKLVVTPLGRMMVPFEHLMGSAGSLEVYARTRSGA
jgi:2-polyprenyl-3-methyl-5-hydroxy-6-metoxy-1,4-benzoquinol methylase